MSSSFGRTVAQPVDHLQGDRPRVRAHRKQRDAPGRGRVRHGGPQGPARQFRDDLADTLVLPRGELASRIQDVVIDAELPPSAGWSSAAATAAIVEAVLANWHSRNAGVRAMTSYAGSVNGWLSSSIVSIGRNVASRTSIGPSAPGASLASPPLLSASARCGEQRGPRPGSQVRRIRRHRGLHPGPGDDLGAVPGAAIQVATAEPGVVAKDGVEAHAGPLGPSRVHHPEAVGLYAERLPEPVAQVFSQGPACRPAQGRP